MISYTITACNEYEELDKLLNVIRINIKEEDEIILQLDSEKTTEEVRQVVKKYEYSLPVLKVIEFSLGGDFSSFKNNLKNHCTKEWIFNIDADEMPSAFLLENIKDILNHNKDIDLLIVPRWNIVNGITARHINLWGWKNDDMGRINWPDWQMRIYKNKKEIRWVNKVHEKIEGYEKYAFLPEDKDYCLFHNKSIEKQESQNSFYNTIG
jgi:hypothetical protein